MTTRGFWELGQVTDARLIASLNGLLASSDRIEARVIAHLAEVDARKLYALASEPSLFEYCRNCLSLSENQAFCRIAAARAARRFPAIFDLLERRALHVTSVALLAKHLTEQNHAQLLREACGKTKAQVLQLLATHWPKPDAHEEIRRLPPAPGSFAMGPTATLEPLSATTYRLQLNASETLRQKLELACNLLSHVNPSRNLALVIERALDTLIAALQARIFGQTRRTKSRVAPPPSKPLHAEQPSTLETANANTPAPRTADKPSVHLPEHDLSTLFHDSATLDFNTPNHSNPPAAKPLDNPREENPLGSDSFDSNPLESDALDGNSLHTNPLGSDSLDFDSDLLDSDLLDSDLLDCALVGTNSLDSNPLGGELLDPNSLGSNPLRGGTALSSNSGAAQVTQSKGHLAQARQTEGLAPGRANQPRALRERRRHIPNELRRQLAQRDGMQCTYCGADGRRCSARSLLQIHHERAWAKGGADTLENLRLVCSAHNKLLAEREFGTVRVNQSPSRARSDPRAPRDR